MEIFFYSWMREKKFTSESRVGEGRIFMSGGNTFEQIFILLACNIHELFRSARFILFLRYFLFLIKIYHICNVVFI